MKEVDISVGGGLGVCHLVQTVEPEPSCIAPPALVHEVPKGQNYLQNLKRDRHKIWHNYTCTRLYNIFDSDSVLNAHQDDFIVNSQFFSVCLCECV